MTVVTFNTYCLATVTMVKWKHLIVTVTRMLLNCPNFVCCCISTAALLTNMAVCSCQWGP